MKSSEELSFVVGEKSMSFLPLDVMLDSYSEPRIESYCTIAKILSAESSGRDIGELELHHHCIVGGDWTSHTIESYSYFVKEGSVIKLQDAESGDRFDLKVTSISDNAITLLVL